MQLWLGIEKPAELNTYCQANGPVSETAGVTKGCSSEFLDCWPVL